MDFRGFEGHDVHGCTVGTRGCGAVVVSLWARSSLVCVAKNPNSRAWCVRRKLVEAMQKNLWKVEHPWILSWGRASECRLVRLRPTVPCG